MQITSPPFWLMIASSATVVLPVWRSPVTSSRWPRPHAADLIFFEIECDARHAALELDQFPRHHVFESVNAGDAVTHRNDGAGLGYVYRFFVILDFLAQYPRDFIRMNLSHNSYVLVESR